MARAKPAREDVIREARKLLNSRSGKRFLLCKLPDSDLFNLYQRLRAGQTLIDCGRWLLKKQVLPIANLDSARHLVAKFKARISPLLLPPPVTTTASDDLPVRDFTKLTDLERITELIEKYSAVLNDELSQAQGGGMLSPNASKHANALSSLLKQKSELQARQEKRDETALSEHEKEIFRSTISALPDQGETLCDMAHNFLKACEEACISMPAGKVAAAVNKC
jgi:hypothetical protein